MASSCRPRCCTRLQGCRRHRRDRVDASMLAETGPPRPPTGLVEGAPSPGCSTRPHQQAGDAEFLQKRGPRLRVYLAERELYPGGSAPRVSRHELHGPPKAILGVRYSTLRLAHSTQKAPGIGMLGIGLQDLPVKLLSLRQASCLMAFPSLTKDFGNRGHWQNTPYADSAFWTAWSNPCATRSYGNSRMSAAACWPIRLSSSRF